MKILTGNDLKTGAVTWWDGQGWSLHVEDAVDVGDAADEIMGREESARRVNVPYAIEAELDGSGKVRPPTSRTACARSAPPCGRT